MSVEVMDFASAEASAQRIVRADGSDPGVLPGAGARMWSHGELRPKAVLILHGYSHTPAQVASLSERFFSHGYNVLAPRAPLHGRVRRDQHARVTAAALRSHAVDAWTMASGLGVDVGVVGISGGAVLATWLATRPALQVRRMLVLAPFYDPHPRRATPAFTAAMRILFRPGLLPDRVSDSGYSYTALAQYLSIAAAIRSVPKDTRLSQVAVALSAADDAVHPETALAVPAAIAAAAGASFSSLLIPAVAELGHDILSPTTLGRHVERVHSRYLQLFEGHSVPC
ncbi:serine aminopeptidase domain-containing protein [Promicromonospora sukumoe]|uniref:serine aminopeptidase domain-containing protein n=1 Tax=Promicromonospora sukumoe TaxID=88382 RepID=UPI0037C94E77